jgi:hypothetical protein
MMSISGMGNFMGIVPLFIFEPIFVGTMPDADDRLVSRR